MKVQEILARLSEGCHLVEFSKKDGTRTIRTVTLDPKLMPAYEAKTDRITKQNPGVVRAWDVKGEKFVGIIPANIHSMN